MGCVTCLESPWEHVLLAWLLPCVWPQHTRGSFREVATACLRLPALLSAHCLQVSGPAPVTPESGWPPDFLSQTLSDGVLGHSFECYLLFRMFSLLLSSLTPGPSVFPFTLYDFLWLLLAGGSFSSYLLDVVPEIFLLEHLLLCSRFAGIPLLLWLHLPPVCGRHFHLSMQPVPPSWASDLLTASPGCPIGTLTSSRPDQITFSLKSGLFHIFPKPGNMRTLNTN